MDLSNKTREELIQLCKEKGVKGYSGKKKDDLCSLLQKTFSSAPQPPLTHADAPAPASVPFTFIDLFCGIGGFHQAMSSLGGTCVLACDIDKKCRDVYFENYGIRPEPDVTKLNTEEMPDFDVLCGGFPCQAFSHAGKQGGFEDTRGTLFRDVARILRDKQPKFFLLENVKNLKGHDGGKTWKTIYKSLCEAGYETYPDLIIMSPHHFGVPQHRERVIIMGVRKDLLSGSGDCARSLPPMPKKFTAKPCNIHSILVKDNEVPSDICLSQKEIRVLEKWEIFVQHFKKHSIKLPTFPLWTDDWDSDYELNELPKWKASFIEKNRSFYTEHQKFLQPWLEEARAIDEFKGAKAKFEWQAGEFKPGDSLWSLLFQYRPSGIRVKRANYSPALVALAQIVVVGAKKRKLCPREVARLQSFPDSFKLPKSNSEAYRRFGNAVNVEVIRQAAKLMFGLV